KDRQMISGTKKVDANFLEKVTNVFDNTEACTICRHAFHSWRSILDDETVLSFIDDWINRKKQNTNRDSKIATSK
ncbi:MAG TPA: hypothetical protein VFH08_13610, partial [Chitinophagaceae bacterium]|nr:hypothetical protein [Chitinophagaceae bacterium]